MSTPHQAGPISNKQETPKLFNNPIIERLSRSHAAVPISMFFIVGGILVYYGISNNFLSVLEAVVSFFTGLFAFSWVEYAMHRYLYHLEPTTESRKNFQYKFHGVHHDFPKDKARLAMPPLISAAIVAILFTLFYYTMGSYVFGFLPGFIIGYASYLWVHYAVHAFRPPSNFLKVLWVHHGVHHYKYPDKAFGVSSPLWDYIYRTMPPSK